MYGTKNNTFNWNPKLEAGDGSLLSSAQSKNNTNPPPRLCGRVLPPSYSRNAIFYFPPRPPSTGVRHRIVTNSIMNYIRAIKGERCRFIAESSIIFATVKNREDVLQGLCASAGVLITTGGPERHAGRALGDRLKKEKKIAFEKRYRNTEKIALS